MTTKIYYIVSILLIAITAYAGKVFWSCLDYVKTTNAIERITISVLGLCVLFFLLGVLAVKVGELKSIKKTAKAVPKLFIACFMSTFLATHSQSQIVQVEHTVGRLDTKSAFVAVNLQPALPVSDLIQTGSKPIQIASAPLDDLPDMLTLTNEASLVVTIVSTIGSRIVTNQDKTVSLILAGSTNKLKATAIFDNGLVIFQTDDGSSYTAKPRNALLVCLVIGGGAAILIWIWWKSRLACSNLFWIQSNQNWMATNVLLNDAFAFSPPPAQPPATSATLPNICPITGSSGMDMQYVSETMVMSDVSDQGWTLGDGADVPVTKVTQEMLYRLYPTNIVLVDTNTGTISPCVFEYSTDLGKTNWNPVVGPGGTVISLSKWYTSTALTRWAVMPCMTVLFIGGVPCYTNVSLSTLNEEGMEVEQPIGFLAGMPRMPGQGKDQAYFRLRPVKGH